MELTNEKYIKLSKFFFGIEVVLNFFYLFAGIVSISIFSYPSIVLRGGIPLLIFNIINISIKLICLKFKLSSKKRVLLYTFLLLYSVFLVVISMFSTQNIFLRVLFFVIILYLNAKYNYFIKFIPKKNN